MFRICTDSAAGFTKTAEASLDISVLPMAENEAGKLKPDEIILREKLQTLSEDCDLLVVCHSGEMSDSFRTICAVAETVSTENAIYVVNSYSTSYGQGMLVRYAAELREEGFSAERTAEQIEKVSRKVCHLFLSGEGEAVISTLDIRGKLIACRKAADRKTALRHMGEMYRRTAEKSVKKVCITHAENPEEAAFLAGQVGGQLQMEKMNEISARKMGKGALALFYLGTLREAPLI